MLLAACTAADSDAAATLRDAQPEEAATSEAVGQADVIGAVGAFELKAREAMYGSYGFYAAGMTAIRATHYQVAISDHHQACGAPVSNGQILQLDFFQDPSSTDARVTQPGVFQAWSLLELRNTEPPGPTDNRVVATWLSHTEFGGQGRVALEGSVSVTEVLPERLSGEFELRFTDGTLKGSFVAPFCENWLLSSSIP